MFVALDLNDFKNDNNMPLSADLVWINVHGFEGS